MPKTLKKLHQMKDEIKRINLDIFFKWVPCGTHFKIIAE